MSNRPELDITPVAATMRDPSCCRTASTSDILMKSASTLVDEFVPAEYCA